MPAAGAQVSSTYVPKPEWFVLDWHRACIEAEALTVQRCVGCGTWRHPPQRFCAGADSTFEPVAGTGVARSLGVSHRSLDRGWQAEVPFATLVDELGEGPRLLRRHGRDFVLVWAERHHHLTPRGGRRSAVAAP